MVLRTLARADVATWCGLAPMVAASIEDLGKTHIRDYLQCRTGPELAKKTLYKSMGYMLENRFHPGTHRA